MRIPTPHIWISKIPLPDGGEVWKCMYCDQVGTFEELTAISCKNPPLSCPWCGKGPICAIWCLGPPGFLGEIRPSVLRKRK